MQTFKELKIQKTPNGFLPRLPLNGKWLDTIGFTTGKGVRVTYHDLHITLTVCDKASDLIVESRMIRHQPRTILTLNAFHLHKYGFRIGDRVGLILNPNTIQLSKIISYITELA